MRQHDDQAAWNRKDMGAAAGLFCEDADFVNARGRHWHGIAQIESKRAELHRLQLKSSVFAPLHVGVQHLGAHTALVAHPLVHSGRSRPGRHATQTPTGRLLVAHAPVLAGVLAHPFRTQHEHRARAVMRCSTIAA